jgi:hypothetical protein
MLKKGTIVLLGLFFVFWMGTAMAGGTEIINGLKSMQITEIYLSAVSTNDWEEDVLGDEVLDPGDSVTVEFAFDETECRWDLMAVDRNGNEVVWENLNLCGIGTITLKQGGMAELR